MQLSESGWGWSIFANVTFRGVFTPVELTATCFKLLIKFGIVENGFYGMDRRLALFVPQLSAIPRVLFSFREQYLQMAAKLVFSDDELQGGELRILS
jgi:hypothetical protein